MIRNTINSNLLLTFFLFPSFIYHCQSISLRTTQLYHEQISTFADVINNSNHVNQQIILLPGSSTPTTTSTTPKIAAAIIIPIICIVLCVIFCFFCFKCAKNQQQQAEQGLQQAIPCYCGPIKCLSKCCSYLLCFDIIMRCLGIRSTNWEKKQKQRLKEEEEKRKKILKQEIKTHNKYGNNHELHPYQGESRSVKWVEISDAADRDRVKKQKCFFCEGKVKKDSNIMIGCSNRCVYHLQCLIDYKKNNKMAKTGNLCPHCKSNYFNIVRFYCQKCWSRYSLMQIQSGNVYGSQLDVQEAIKSIGGDRCDECSNKRWFWQ